MSTQTDPNDFLLGGGAPSVKFPTIGTMVKGTITDMVVNQQTDFTTGKPKFYDDGNKMMQLVVTLATEERDPSIDADDGTRRLFVRGQMMAAVREAVKRTGKPIANGGILAVKYVSDGTASQRGLNPPKQYQAEYAPPTSSEAANSLLGADENPAGTDASSLI